MNCGFPIGRQAGLGVSENFDDCLPIGSCEVREILARVLTAEHVPQFLVDVVLDLARERVEGGRIHQVAARILEQSTLEIEVAQRATSPVPWSMPGEFGREAGRALNRLGEGGFFAEEEAFDERLTGGSERSRKRCRR